MRCYFLIDGHIAGIEMMTGLSDRDAVTKARLLFSERMIPFDGYEVWDQTRFVFRHQKGSCALKRASRPS